MMPLSRSSCEDTGGGIGSPNRYVGTTGVIGSSDRSSCEHAAGTYGVEKG